MEQQVILSIRGQQIYDGGGEPEVTELVTEGTLELTQEGCTLRYAESELTGLEGTRTTFHIVPGCVTLLREGQVTSEMVFEEGRRHLSMYSTPYGTMAMGVNTHKMLVDVNSNGGEVLIDYDLELNHAVASENVFSIIVRVPKS